MHRPHFGGQVGPIGIDFSAHGVRMLQLRRAGSGLRVVAGGIVENPNLGDSPERAVEALTQAVHARLASFGFRGRKCVVALPREDLLLQSVRLPQLAGKELKQAVRWEAAERLHLEHDSLEVDYIRMGEIVRPSEARDEVLLVAALRERLLQRLEPLMAAGLRPVAVDAPFTALARIHSMRCRRESDRAHVRGLLEVGATGSTFMVLRGDQIAMCKPLAYGGRDFDRAVAAHLGIEADIARDLRARRIHERLAGSTAKKATDDSTDRAVFEAVRPIVDQLIKEVGLCLRYFNVTFRGKPADQIVLAGGDGLEPRLDEMLSRGSKVPVVIDDPVSPVSDLLQEVSHALTHVKLPPQSWAVAAGLSVRGLVLRALSGRDNPPQPVQRNSAAPSDLPLGSDSHGQRRRIAA